MIGSLTTKLVIASEAKQSRLFVRPCATVSGGLLRFARNDDDESAIPYNGILL